MNKEINIIRKWLAFFIVSLAISGFTAIPIETELDFLTRFFSIDTSVGQWLWKVDVAVADMNKQYPFLAYGYDWLAFAHFMLAILFIGPYKNPVRNRWVIEFGIYACLLVLPYAFIAGYFRGIPLGWRLIDCSFGVIGLIPLFICRTKINGIEKALKETTNEYHIV